MTTKTSTKPAATTATKGRKAATGTKPRPAPGRTPKAEQQDATADPKTAAVVEVAYTVTPKNFWTSCRDGALAYAAEVPGVQAVRADNARRVLVIAGTKAGTAKAAAKVGDLWPAAVAALREQDKANRAQIAEQRKTTEGRAQRWANEQAFLSAYVASGGAL